MNIPPYVIYEILAGESVAINLQTGAYYLLGSAASAAMQGVTSGPVVEKSSVFSALVHEGLLIDSDPCDQSIPADGPEFFQKFTDLESMLAADPVHDVDDFGWPKIQ